MLYRNQYSMKFADEVTSNKFPKRTPALTDDDPMPFGKYGPKGENRLMKDVPAAYLAYLWVEKCDNTLVYNYIWNSFDAINQDLPEDKKILR